VTVGPPVMIATAKAPDSDEISKRQAQGLFKNINTQIRSQNLRQGTLEFNNI
jgi:hypothetical protein